MKFLDQHKQTQEDLVDAYLYDCNADLLRREASRWKDRHKMDMLERLRLMTNPEKIRVFIILAATYNDKDLYRAGIQKAVDLNYKWVIPRFPMISLLRDSEKGEESVTLARIRKIRP